MAGSWQSMLSEGSEDVNYCSGTGQPFINKTETKLAS